MKAWLSNWWWALAIVAIGILLGLSEFNVIPKHPEPGPILRWYKVEPYDADCKMDRIQWGLSDDRGRNGWIKYRRKTIICHVGIKNSLRT